MPQNQHDDTDVRNEARDSISEAVSPMPEDAELDSLEAAADQAQRYSPPPGRLASFGYAISHDLGAPLRAVTVALDLIGKRHAALMDDSGRALMRHAAEGARRMQLMIDGLAEISRIRQRHCATALIPLDDLIDEAIGAQIAEVDATGGHVSVDPLPAIVADERQLAMLLTELIANSLKFARPDVPPHIEIRALPQQAHLVLAIRDNGIGVPADRAARIFEPFQRLQAAGDYPGLGLGLTRCREIAEAHRGFIYAYPNATPDSGLTVILGLPN